MNGQEPITDTEGLLINVSGILLAILLGMSFLGNTTNRYLIFLSAISVILLVGCITLCLWYKHRIKLRKEIFSKLLNEFLKTFETSLTEFGELAEAQGKNDAQIFFREHGGLLKDKTPEEAGMKLINK